MAATLASSALAALAPARAVAHRGRGAVAAPTLTPSRVTLRGAPLRSQHSRRSVPAAPSAAGRGGVKRVLAMAAATSVRIIIQGRHLEVTPGIRDHCEDKIVKAIKNFEGNIKEVDVKLSVRGGDAGTGARAQRVELTLYTLRHGVVRAEDVEDSLYAAIDLVCDKLKRKLRKLKEKAVDRGTWPGAGGKAGQTPIYEVLSSQDVVDDLELDRVAALPEEVLRAKYLQLEPMSVEDATERMEAIGHDFFVFRELETNEIQIVYKRKERGMGVLIPRD